MRLPGRRRPRAGDPETALWRLGRERVVWLTGAMALVLAPHMTRVPPWASALFVIFAIWRLANVLLAVRLPPGWLTGLLGLAVLPGVYAAYGTLTGRSAGIALLVVLTGMKLVEVRSLRDAFFVCFLGYFLVVTGFLFSQTIAMGAYMLAVVLVMTATLVSMSSAAPVRATVRLRLAARMLAQAAPVALVLFFVFPRLPGPLWGLPKDAHAAVSGLSDTMSPGNISSLGLSDAVAFRVDFEGETPERSALYWRGPVLWHTDGRTWTQARPGVSAKARFVEPAGPPVDYEVIIEPHQRRWLFALDAPATLPPASTITEDVMLLAAKPVRQRTRYRVRSYPGRRLTHLGSRQEAAALALAPGAHPRARDLAARWREAAGGNPRAVVGAALAYFREAPFRYTLTPPRLERDPVDEFLFETRSGFCEHYASAFAVLMRASGIPARIVTGYQGGELNEVAGYLLVRQRDAHAWTEVWLPGEGWVRIDPTAAVAPSRVERGMDATIAPVFGPRMLAITPSEPVRAAWRRMRQGWDAVNHRWNTWVLGYGPERQRRFLARFGLDAGEWTQLAAVLAVSIGVLLGALALWLARPARRADALARLYARFCRKVARAGVERAPAEGPVDFAARIARERPALAARAARVTELYVQARYASGEVDARELRRAVRAFSP